MVTTLPRVVVAAPSTGQGKTTLATGLMAALRAAGHEVSGHKVGPDYIDPGYHALATGRPGRNLDPHLVGEERIVPLLLHGARRADIAVVEGVMGLHDGRLGTGGFASTAHVARLTDSPVLLVVDIARMSRSAAAVVHGMAVFDPGVNVAGVILNRCGSARNTTEIRTAVTDLGYRLVGEMPRDADLATPSRHLGLVPATERRESARLIERLGEQVAAHVDLSAVLAVARTAPDLAAEPWDPAREVTSSGTDRPVVAVAGGRAFTFRYPETDDLLRAAGCEVVPFDPACDTLPDGTRGIYLGGGFPEVYAEELAANRTLLHQVRWAADEGVPIVAECAGLLYLARTLDDATMARVVPATAAMTERLTLRYPVATATVDTLLTRAGESVTGHEFHRTRTEPAAGHTPAWVVDDAPTGFAGPTLHAAYLHVHWAGHPQLAQRFADAVHAAPVASPPASDLVRDGVTAGPAPGDPLRHHGDQDATTGLVDLAVNVHPGRRPSWLDRALHRSLDDADRYPDPAQAHTTIAAHHDRPVTEVLATSGAAEAFTLVARLRPWRRPVVVHPQFTEPHAALEATGRAVTPVLLTPQAGFALDPSLIPEDADLVVVGNPTNPTGVLHPAAVIRSLLRPGRLVVVDEAFLDAGPGESESLAAVRAPGLVVIRSLTKLWSIPGIRAGHLTGDADTVAALAALQPPWSVSGPALVAIAACLAPTAAPEATRRAAELATWRTDLQARLAVRDIGHVPSAAPFVLARIDGVTRTALRDSGFATRRADTFPGLDDGWTRLAARPPATLDRFFDALDRTRRG